MVSEPGDDQHRANGNRRRTDHATPGRNRTGVASSRVQCLVNGPASQSFDNRTGASQVNLIVSQWQFKAAGERFVATNRLPEGSWCFVAQMDGQCRIVLLQRHVGRLQHGKDKSPHVIAAANGLTNALQFRSHRVAIQ